MFYLNENDKILYYGVYKYILEKSKRKCGNSIVNKEEKGFICLDSCCHCSLVD